MTDRELLELAAKAAGVDGAYDSWVYMGIKEGIRRNGCPKYFRPWNPLTNDGDALRLAVKLRIGLGDRETVVTAFHKQGMSKGAVYVEEYGDPCAATRRAIVRAAAEIGKAMQ